MSDKEKFEAFKENIVRENEKRYGAEVREQFGDEEMDASNRKMLSMTKEQYERFQGLSSEIINCLEELVQSGGDLDTEESRHVFLLHKEWLSMTWKNYTKEAHMGIAKAYAADERFKAYYDKKVPGCAETLQKVINYWAVS